MQEVAAAAVSDGCPCPHLQRVANIGSHGAHPQNCERDLEMHMRPSPVKSILKDIQLPMLNPFQVVTVVTPMLYPHELFATIYKHHPSMFLRRLCGKGK